MVLISVLSNPLEKSEGEEEVDGEDSEEVSVEEEEALEVVDQ